MSGVESIGRVEEPIIMYAMKNNIFVSSLSFAGLLGAICLVSTAGCSSDPCEDYRVQIRKAQAVLIKDGTTEQEGDAAAEKFIKLSQEALENGCKLDN